jgi:multiple sugar transport system ATP-binding protein
MSVLVVQNLSKTFGSNAALRSIDLEISQGEVLALLGPTGAGKTTTLRCLAGLEKPDAGRVFIDQRDVTEASPRERDVAVVFEGFNLLPTLSVYDNIAFPLRSPVYKTSEPEIRRKVTRTSDDLHIGHLLQRRVSQLSGGERQRVAIARALVRRPRLLLLDEPLSALDLKLREALQNELKEMQRRDGATVVYASHDFPSAAQIADRLALIQEGRILQTAPLATLFAEPASASVGRLVGSPAMALFEASIRDGGAAVAHYGLIEAAACARIPTGTPVKVGLWPEDITVSATPGQGLIQGRVYATDFRGRDRALEVHFGESRFRKVVDLSMDRQQNDAIWFRLPPECAYLFDSSHGHRMRVAEAQVS